MISAFVVLECSVTHTKNPKLTLYHKTRAPAPHYSPKRKYMESVEIGLVP